MPLTLVPPPDRANYDRSVLAAFTKYTESEGSTMTTQTLVAIVGTLAFAMVATAAPPEIALRAEAVLTTHCYRCHGDRGSAEGGMNYVLDRQRLLETGTVQVESVSKSPLYERVASGEMPADTETTPTKEDLAVLADWIRAGAPDFNEPAPERTWIDDEQVAKFIVADLQRQTPRDRPYLRYLTITHLYNAGVAADELQTYRNALTKLVNSLSLGRKIYIPPAVDPERTILRIDLRKLRWTFTQWSLVCLVTNSSCLAPQTSSEREAAGLTQCNVFSLHGDRFAYHASRPPLYHMVPLDPKTDAQLEEFLGVETTIDYLYERYLRAGFNGSGVSTNNRLIERHESDYGGYWKSFDFGRGTGQGNLFEHPLGPGQKPSDFVHDGGEIIYSLPNGLQGYLLVDADGNRIDVGPINIVSDPSQPDRSVTNGVSCMGCHSRGLIRKADEVRAHVQQNSAAFTPEERSAVEAVYRQAELEAAFDEDIARFARAIEECGIPYSKTEPILALVKKHEEELNERELAAELGLDPRGLRDLLAKRPELARTYGPVLTPGGVIKREVLEADLASDRLFEALGRRQLLTQGAAKMAKENSGVAVEGGVYDFALMLERQAAPTAVSFETLASRGYRVEVETLPEPLLGAATLGAWHSSDRQRRNDLVFDYASQERKARNSAVFTAIVGQPNGVFHAAVAIDKSKFTPPEVDAVYEAFMQPFRERRFNEAVAELVRSVDRISKQHPAP